jgi:hypothetical protein
MQVSRVSEMRGLDRTAIDEFGTVEEAQNAEKLNPTANWKSRTL